MSSPTNNPSVVAQTIVAVHNVRLSSQWYAVLLNAEALPEHAHRDFYDCICVAGQPLLQLHVWDEGDHPNLIHPDLAPAGHGVALGFQVYEFDDVVSRAIGLKAKIIKDTHFNSGPRRREIWLRDPDGYFVVISSPNGEFDV